MSEFTPPNDNASELGEAEFRELADNAPVMIWRARADKLMDWCNQRRQVYSGKTLEQLFGYGWTEDIHPEDFDACIRTYRQAFETREPFTLPYRLRRHDGVFRWFLDNGTPFYRHGEFAGFFGSCTDITEQKELEAHQQVLLAELDHRVKNNLQLIIAFLQMAKIRSQGDEARDLMEAAIARIQGVGAVQAELHRSPTGYVDLASYLPNLINASIRAESGVEADLAIDAQSIQVPFKLASDLGLIINELITNALKHGAGERCAIAFGLRRMGDDLLQVTVQDAGQGFGADQLTPPGSGDGKLRGQGLIGALAKRCNAQLTRSNAPGALVTVVIPLPQ